MMFSSFSNPLVLLELVLILKGMIFIICWQWYLCVQFLRWCACTLGCTWHEQPGLLRLTNFVAGGNCTAVQNAVQLTQLTYGRFKVSNSLRWYIWDTSEFLTCLIEKFGASISSVVTWHSVNRVIYVAKRLTAASSIASYQANKMRQGGGPRSEKWLHGLTPEGSAVSSG